MRTFYIVLTLLFLTVSGSEAAEPQPVKPTPKDKCPVCGMFVAHFPDFLAQIIYDGGGYDAFDGPKDFFKYYLKKPNLPPTKKGAGIVAVFVTDYYSLVPTNAFKAYYVLGSDVLGPMGKELIPFAKETEAQEFMKDHKGKSVLKFEDISPATLKELE